MAVWVIASTENHMQWCTVNEWLLASLIGGLVIGCASDRALGTDNQRTHVRNTTAVKQPEIVHRQGFLVMGRVTHRKPGAERPEMFVAIWNDFEAHQQRIKGHSVDSKYYGVNFAPGPDGSFDYLAGMAVRPVAETPEGLEVRMLPAATYAVFPCPAQSIGQTYRYIFGQWRGEAGYETDATMPAFEEYPPATEANAPVLLHIPIRAARAK